MGTNQAIITLDKPPSSVQQPRMKPEFVRQSFNVLTALCFNSFPQDITNLDQNFIQETAERTYYVLNNFYPHLFYLILDFRP